MDPKQIAALAAKFLARTSLAPSERQEYAAVEQTLAAIQRGELVIGKPMVEEKKVGRK